MVGFNMQTAHKVAILALLYQVWHWFFTNKLYPARNLIVKAHVVAGLEKLPAYQEILASEDTVNVLDFGCGQGDTAGIIRGIFGSKANITSLDVYLSDRWSADDATTRRKYDGDVIPYDKNFFKFALAGQVLHHIPDNKRSVEEMGRVAENLVIVEDLVTHGSLQSKFYFFWDSLCNADWFKHPPHSNRDSTEWPALFEELNLALVGQHYTSLVFAKTTYDATVDNMINAWPLVNVVYSLQSK
jgi:SAM-dependent methyltransferase